MSRTSILRDQRAKLMEWSAEHAPHVIQTLFHAGKISPEQAIERLERSSINGQLLAGKIALEQAFNVNSVDESIAWFIHAKHNFETTVQLSNLSKRKACESRAQAMIHLAQMPNAIAIAQTGKLPSIDVMQASYEATLEAGSKISREYRDARAEDRVCETTKSLAGVVGETAVLLLGQRYAITGMQDSSWTMMQSLYSGDHANTHGSHLNHAWDIEVLSELGNGIQVDNYVQVKTARHNRKDSKTDDVCGISRLHIDPDLRLETDRSFESLAIIGECVAAEDFDNEFIQQRVVDRTELLLDFLDQ